MKKPGPRMTLPTQLVLRSLLADPTREMYGLEICTEAGLPSGTIHPILARLEGLGWLESRWEDDASAHTRVSERGHRAGGVAQPVQVLDPTVRAVDRLQPRGARRHQQPHPRVVVRVVRVPGRLAADVQ